MNPAKRPSFLRKSLSAGALALGMLVASTAIAQTPPATGGPKPPTPGKEDASAPLIWNYFIVIVLLVTAVGANMIPSKRGHQD
jgi:hypothetical protein